MARDNCPECGGSGLRMGTYGDLTCFDCGGEGSWLEDPKCAGCDQAFDANGYCPRCEEYAATPTELLPENKHRWVA